MNHPVLFRRCDVSRYHEPFNHASLEASLLPSPNAPENRKSDFLTTISHQPNRTTRFEDEKRDWNRQLISNPETSEVSSSVGTHRTQTRTSATMYLDSCATLHRIVRPIHLLYLPSFLSVIDTVLLLQRCCPIALITRRRQKWTKHETVKHERRSLFDDEFSKKTFIL